MLKDRLTEIKINKKTKDDRKVQFNPPIMLPRRVAMATTWTTNAAKPLLSRLA